MSGLLAHLLALGLIVCSPAVAAAAAGPQLAAVRGVVLDASRTGVAGTSVTLLDRVGITVASVTTDDYGRFSLHGVPAGTYTLRAESIARGAVAKVITVSEAWPLDVTLELGGRVEDTVVVEGGSGEPLPTTRMTVSGEALRLIPSRLSHRALQQMLATLPGWAGEDNGLLHVRGVDDGVLFVHDGVPVYDRLDAVFGIPPDPAGIGSLNVLTGYIPPEYGLKAGAVVEVQSPAARPDRWLGNVDVAAGSDRMIAVRGGAGGSLGTAGRIDFSAGSERSDRFLDPVHPDNFHNTGSVGSGEVHLTFRPAARDLLRLGASGGRSRYDVPHGQGQEAAGHDQRQTLGQTAQSGSWQRVWSDALVTQLSVHRRALSSSLLPSATDTPVTAQSDRQQDRVGIRAVATLHHQRHTVKTGVEASRLHLAERFTFAVTDPEAAEDAEISDEAAEFTTDHPFVFADRVRRPQWSLFIQDSIRVSERLTVDLGVRFDRTHLLVSARQWSPRAGAAYSWPARRVTLRASVNRFFQPPQPEHLLLSSSADARALSPFALGDPAGGGSDLHPERQTAWEAGVEKWFAGLVRVDAAWWNRHVRNYADPNVFFGTTIIFPNSVHSGEARGLDVRVEMPRYQGWSAYGSYTFSEVEQVGPINGGLFLEDAILEIGLGTRFTPDHDQRHTAAAGVTFQARRGPSVVVAVRHGSGTPLEVEEDDLDELQERPGSELVDFDRLRVRARTIWDLSLLQPLRRDTGAPVTVGVSLLNATGRAYALNFGNPFSGTHFGEGRTLRLDLRIELR